MKVIHFENFENDTLESLPLRYPDTRHGTFGIPTANCFPLQRLGTGTAASNDAILGLGRLDEIPGRLDFLFEFEDNGDVASTSTGCFMVLYNNVTIRGVSADRLRIQQTSDSNLFYEMDVPNLKSIKQLYVIVDYVAGRLTVFADGELYANRIPISWAFTPSGINNLVVDATATSVQNPHVPNMLRSIIVVQDMPAGRMLDTETTQILLDQPTMVEQQNFAYSDQGFSEDVDKDDPLLEMPGVYTEGLGHIVYESSGRPQLLSRQAYPAIRSDLEGRQWSMNDGLVHTAGELSVVPPFVHDGLVRTDVFVTPIKSLLHGRPAPGTEIPEDMLADGGTWVRSGTVATALPNGGPYGTGAMVFNANGGFNTTRFRPLLVAGTPFTLELMFRVDNIGSSGYGMLVCSQSTYTNRQFALFVHSSGTLRFFVNSVQTTLSDPITWGSGWHHLALQCENGTVQAFVDGKMQSQTASIGTASTAQTLALGYNHGYSATADAFIGQIAEFRFTDSLLYDGDYDPQVDPFPHPRFDPHPTMLSPVAQASFYYDADKLFFPPGDLRAVYVSDTSDL